MKITAKVQYIIEPSRLKEYPIGSTKLMIFLLTPKLFELRHRLRISRLAAGRAEGEQERLPDQRDQRETRAAEEQIAGAASTHHRIAEAQIELDHELAVGHEYPEALRRHRSPPLRRTRRSARAMM